MRVVKLVSSSVSMISMVLLGAAFVGGSKFSSSKARYNGSAIASFSFEWSKYSLKGKTYVSMMSPCGITAWLVLA